MERKSKSQPARKTAAKTAAKRKAAPAKASGAKAGAKKAAPGKPAARTASKQAKPKNIFAKKKKSAKSGAKIRPDQGSITQNLPLIEALDRALSGPPPEYDPQEVAASGERRSNGASETSGSDQARPPGWRPSLSETNSESADTPARINKLVPTNAVHTTKRRMKRNTWQSPVLGLGAVAAVLVILVLANKSEPPDVSPLERLAEVRRDAGTQQTAKAPPMQDPLQAAPELRPQIPARLAQPPMPPVRSNQTARGEQQEQDLQRGLRVLELVEMERMLARLDMEPSQPDGVVDQQTETAIRMYQQIAGLPVDGEPSTELLDDMREVVKMMDGTD